MAGKVKRKNKRKNKKNTVKKIGIITGAFASVLVISILVLVLVLVHFIEKVNYVPIKEDYTILAETETFIEDVTNPEETTVADSSDEEIDEYQQAVEEALSGVNNIGNYMCFRATYVTDLEDYSVYSVIGNHVFH